MKVDKLKIDSTTIEFYNDFISQDKLCLEMLENIILNALETII